MQLALEREEFKIRIICIGDDITLATTFLLNNPIQLQVMEDSMRALCTSMQSRLASSFTNFSIPFSNFPTDTTKKPI